MKKIFAFSAMCATILAATSCGGGEKNEVVAPAEEPTAWSDVNTFDTNGEVTAVEKTNYGQNGLVVSTDRQVADKETKQLTLAEHVIYQNGKPVYGDTYRADGTVDGHMLYTYNDKGLLTEQVIETYSDGLKRIAPSSRYIYEYDANGDVTSIKEQKSVPSGWATDYEWTYTYDAQARLTGRADYTGDGKDRKQSCQYGWSYVEGSDKVKQLDYFTYDLKQQKLKHDAKTHYDYNAAGQVVKATVIRHKNNQKREDINSRQYEYLLNAAGQVTSVIESRWNNSISKWYEVSKTVSVFDEAGQLYRTYINKNTNKGPRTYTETHEQGAPAGQPNVAAAQPSYVVKPVINLDDKHQTSKDED